MTERPDLAGLLALLDAGLPDDLNATLREVVGALFLHLVEDGELVDALGLDRLAEIAIGQMDRLSFDLGGASFYLPKGIGCKLSVRDREIGERYNGRNKHLLAREFGVSDMRIDQIYKRWRQAEMAKRQGVLGFSIPV